MSNHQRAFPAHRELEALQILTDRGVLVELWNDSLDLPMTACEILAFLDAGVEDGVDARRWVEDIGLSDPVQIGQCIDAYYGTPGVERVYGSYACASEWVARGGTTVPSEIRRTLQWIVEDREEQDNE